MEPTPPRTSADRWIEGKCPLDPLAPNPQYRRMMFSPRRAVLHLGVMVVVATAASLALGAWTDLAEGWRIAVSVAAGNIVATLTVGLPFTPKERQRPPS
jgi:hypothetical protein